jgi:hypothetical protein
MAHPVAGVDYPESWRELLVWFPDDAACLGYLERLRWPDGFVCPACGGAERWRMHDGLLRCSSCDRRTSATAGTIFAGTRSPLSLWFAAAWYITNQKSGVSALGLQRALELGSYETAWAWLHKFRRAMVRPGRDKLTGEVEVDETYVGGVAPGKHGRGAEKKTVVLIAVEKRGRGMGRVRFARVQDTTGDSLLPAIEELDRARQRRLDRRPRRLQRRRRRRLPPRPAQPLRQRRSRSRRDAARTSCRLAAQALAARHSPGRRPSAAARLLPRRVQLPLQPAWLQPPRPALLPAPRASRPHRAETAGEDARRRLIAN